MRWLVLLLGVALVGFDRPALDDFYERSRERGDDFEHCLYGYCDGEYLLQLLLGAQVANPSRDRLRPLLAEGLRLGVDAGWNYQRLNLVRSKAWVDWLREQESGEQIVDLWWRNTWFHDWRLERELRLHFFVDAVAASRDELQPADFADLQLSPYRVVDVETEVAYVGPKIDKDGSLAVPVGVSWRRRWNLDDTPGSVRRSTSGAVALRGSPRGIRHHYQLDFLRVTRVDWNTGAGAAAAWRATLGYQRLSPGIDMLDIWLLTGYGWHEGINDPSGMLAQLGARVGQEGIYTGLAYEAWFALDQRTNRFRRVHRVEVSSEYDLGRVMWKPRYEYATVATEGSLHTVDLVGGWRPDWLFGLMLGAGVRFVWSSGTDDASAPDENRFNVQLDWLL